MFRLRPVIAVLVLLAVLGGLVAPVLRGWPSEWVTRQALKQFNTGVCRFEGDPVTAVTFGETYAGDRAMEHIGRFRSLRRLELPHVHTLSDRAMDHLAGLPELTDLEFYYAPITGDAIRRLIPLPRLRRLSLFGTRVDDRGLSYLAAFPELEDLSVSGTPVTDAGMKHLGGLTRLRKLCVAAGGVGDRGLAELAGLPAWKSCGWATTASPTPGFARCGAWFGSRPWACRTPRPTPGWPTSPDWPNCNGFN